MWSPSALVPIVLLGAPSLVLGLDSASGASFYFEHTELFRCSCPSGRRRAHHAGILERPVGILERPVRGLRRLTTEFKITGKLT